MTGGATVNGVAVTNWMISETSENALTAVYTFSFDYNGGTETGTLTFYKTGPGAGTYTIDLANPIAGVSIVQTATGSLFQGYELGTLNFDNSQPDVSVTQVSANAFVQFTSVAEPSSGTGANNLSTTSGDLTFTNGEFFTQASTWVSTMSVSTTARRMRCTTPKSGPTRRLRRNRCSTSSIT